MRKLSLLLLLMTACVGADTPEDRVTLTLSESRPSPGDSVDLVLSNGTSSPVAYNLCPSTLSRDTGGGWAPVPSDRICTMELRTLGPGDEDRFEVELPANLEPGRYRWDTGIVDTATDAPEGIATDPFDVE